jgi:hypothetical protein
LKTAQELGVETIVAVPGIPSTSQIRYNRQDDTYTYPRGRYCVPMGHGTKQLSSTGSVSWFKQYKTKACRSCPAHSSCTRSKDCRLIQRSEFADYYERNLTNTREKEHLYRRRQAIVEHPYGTDKAAMRVQL